MVSIPLRKFRKWIYISSPSFFLFVSIPLRKFRKGPCAEILRRTARVSIPLRKFRKQKIGKTWAIPESGFHPSKEV